MIKLKKTYNLVPLLLKLILKDIKIYIVSLLIPCAISFLLYWVWSTIILNVVYSPQMFGFLSIGCLIVPFYLSILICEWKSTNFLKKIKSINLNQINFTVVMILINIIFSLISIIASTILAVSITSTIRSFPISYNLLFKDIDWYIWINFIFSSLLMSIVALLMFIVFTNFFRSKILNITVSIGVLTYIVFLSDVVIIPHITSKITSVSIIEYFNPIKYCVWIIYMITSYQFIDNYGIQQILSTNNISNLFISFNNILVPLLISLLIVGIFILIIKYRFIWGTKN
ncbi:hypothetical protein SCORR_v1c06370 [Spiroplasma corruscae]|uniref:Uncharacterized protein n=1 Tax=Spiroplasma corruscae TaxID=216934 RepID=A0A222EPG3_9MOLU|nr:hypothetical protein [Spiroplasma corruscae]ASP28409.1 hypothetical protein SCORR_v1c06370 [Spiroplasma corruscae]